MKKLAYAILIVVLAVSIVTPVSFAAEGSSSSNLLKQGILGAGVGAIAAGASGGKAGKGALIGAGANIAGNVIMDAVTEPSQPAQQVQQVQAAPVQSSASTTYQEGFNAGFQQGYQKGYESGRSAR
ncbi:MAG: hypothetical protein NTV07_06755 [Candidatus Omnitrophica bacterium]|nr:hypothetical protein [Candidatus Omnitrophota bacterium]